MFRVPQGAAGAGLAIVLLVAVFAGIFRTPIGGSVSVVSKPPTTLPRRAPALGHLEASAPDVTNMPSPKLVRTHVRTRPRVSVRVRPGGAARLVTELDTSASAVTDAEHSVSPPPVLAKEEAMQNGLNVGRAIVEFVADHENRLPTVDDVDGGMLAHYLSENPGADAGFVYLFNGERYQDVGQPNSTPLGYVVFDGGRAMVYMDGHVQAVGPDDP